MDSNLELMEAKRTFSDQVKEDERRRKIDKRFERNIRTFFGPDGPVYEHNAAFS